MATQTGSERVKEAMDKAGDILGGLVDTKEVVVKARAAYQLVRDADQTVVMEADREAKVAEFTDAARQAEVNTVEAASKVLDTAQASYNRKATEAHNKCNDVIDKATDDLDQAIDKAKQEQAVKDAAAKSEIHTAQQQVAKIEADFESYRKQVLAQLGIDLGGLINVSG